eukprot:15880516-Heterocapsa_arctica.AAC.1
MAYRSHSSVPLSFLSLPPSSAAARVRLAGLVDARTKTTPVRRLGVQDFRRNLGALPNAGVAVVGTARVTLLLRTLLLGHLVHLNPFLSHICY